MAGLVVCFLRQLCSFLCRRHENGENHKAEECGYQSGNNGLTKVDAEEHSFGHMFQIDYGNGSKYQRGNGSCRGGFLPEVSQYIGEEGTGSSEGKAEHQDGNNALGVEKSNKHGSDTYQNHGNLGYVHNFLAAGIWLKEDFENVIGKDGSGSQKVGVGTGHGGGDNTGEEQAANDSRHGANRQNR